MNPETFEHAPQFERISIHPKWEGGIFLDNNKEKIDGYVNFGEWVYGKEGAKDFRGNLKLKTIEFATSDVSKFTLWVTDKKRLSYREVPHKYVMSRKPMVYGDSKNVKTGIRNEGITGFRIDMVSYEGNQLRRTKTRS